MEIVNNALQEPFSDETNGADEFPLLSSLHLHSCVSMALVMVDDGVVGFWFIWCHVGVNASEVVVLVGSKDVHE